MFLMKYYNLSEGIYIVQGKQTNNIVLILLTITIYLSYSSIISYLPLMVLTIVTSLIFQDDLPLLSILEAY